MVGVYIILYDVRTISTMEDDLQRTLRINGQAGFWRTIVPLYIQRKQQKLWRTDIDYRYPKDQYKHNENALLRTVEPNKH